MAEKHPEAVLLHRLRSMAWWRAVMAEFPGGVLPQYLAADLLGISDSRMKQHRQEGKLRYLFFLGSSDPRMVMYPVDDLWRLGTIADRGRRGTYGEDRRRYKNVRLASSTPLIFSPPDYEQKRPGVRRSAPACRDREGPDKASEG